MKLIRAPSIVHTLYPQLAAFLIIVLILCIVPATLEGQTGQLPNASTETVLYQFTGGVDGGTPTAGVVFDQAGNLYGTTKSGGLYGHGTVYELSPSGGGWTETVLYSFTGGLDGDSPYGGLYIDEYGHLWGTTYKGGDSGCQCGTLFDLIPTQGGWIFDLAHAFTGGSDDGANPTGRLASVGWGILGTTQYGGASNRLCSLPGCGTIFWLSSNGYSIWNKFTDETGQYPRSGLVFDPWSNCFLGTTYYGAGPWGGGTVFTDCERYIYTVHTFAWNGATGRELLGGVILDDHGNIFGTTSQGDGFKGAVFKISPGQWPWVTKALHQFLGYDGATPVGDLLLDADGNIYGTTSLGGVNNQGVVFKLTPQIKQKWAETLLYSFTGSDGATPLAGLVFDGADNLYGTTSAGGASGAGVVFKVPNLRVGPQATLTRTRMGFGKQIIYTSSTARTVTLSNTGDTLLAISNISITPSGSFAISSNTCGAKLGPGTQCKVSVTFTPNNVGTLTGTLTFTDNAPNSPQTVALTGIGVWPASLMPASATYLKQPVGTTSLPKTFTLTNNQAVSLDGIAISTTGDFAVSATTCTTSLPANSKCTISVTFTPTEAGTRTGTLSVSDSANNSPQTSSLTGTGK